MKTEYEVGDNARVKKAGKIVRADAGINAYSIEGCSTACVFCLKVNDDGDKARSLQVGVNKLKNEVTDILTEKGSDTLYWDRDDITFKSAEPMKLCQKYYKKI